MQAVCRYCLLVLLFALDCAGVTHAATVVKPVRAVLLLHGMGSDLTKWKKLVNSTAGFDGRCDNPLDASFPKGKPKPNSEGIYCMRLNFGIFDRLNTAPRGLDNKTCSEVGGCSGDYSTFETQGIVISKAISRIRSKLGVKVQVILLGHSRGGIAARAFLQGADPLKKNVVGLITTGTPHVGTPLGRYYTYLQKFCLPESKYDGIDIRDCAHDWRFVNFIKDTDGLDLKSPSFGFLSELSPAIKALNANISKLPKIQVAELSYDNVKFGCLGGAPINGEKDCGYDIFGNILPLKPSGRGLKVVLNNRSRDSLKGDGIVPVYSQKMSKLKGWVLPIRGYLKSKRIHTVETDQILDLTTALKNMYTRLGW